MTAFDGLPDGHRAPHQTGEHAVLATLLEDAHVTVRFVAPDALLLARTARSLPSPELEMRDVYERLVGVLPQARAQVDFIVDTRKAPGRNDAVFEKLQSEFHDRLFGGFRQVIALVKTATGHLQLDRYEHERPKGVIVVGDVDEALEVCRRLQGRPRASSL
ncbi:MAG: hypothetical protein AB8I08_34970 [Sandaracinaceae bacterium]